MPSKQICLLNKSFVNAGAIVTRNASNIFGPGNSTGSGISTSSGSTISVTKAFVNRSGAPITIGSLTFAGWILTTAGTSSVGNDTPLTGNIEYPVGVTFNSMLQNGSASLTIPNGGKLTTDQVTLTTSIPAGATFNVNLSATQANGQKYIAGQSFTGGATIGFGLCGINTTALKSSLAKEMIFAVGDSIMTNNGGALTTTCATAICPSLQMSIAGTTAQTYGGSSAANFTKQVSIAIDIGATRFVSDLGTNDFGSNGTGSTAAQLLGFLQSMRTLAIASGMKFTQTTMTPRTSRLIQTASSTTSSTNVISMTVPDATLFAVNNPYVIAGANETGYNGNRVCLSTNSGTNVITFPCLTGITSPATGTVTVNSYNWSTRGLQTPVSTQFSSGPNSDRGKFNAAVRANAFDGYIDWGDACELVRDDGIWAIGGDKPELVIPQVATVLNAANTATTFLTNYTGPSTTMAGGYAIFTSGANIGETHGSSTNTNGSYTSGVAFANTPANGDTVFMESGSYPSDDGLHPRTAFNTAGTASYRGGQALIVNSAINWLNNLLII